LAQLFPRRIRLQFGAAANRGGIAFYLLLPDGFLQLAAAQLLTFFANPLPSLAQVPTGHLPE
jgi:hypothetical protein